MAGLIKSASKVLDVVSAVSDSISEIAIAGSIYAQNLRIGADINQRKLILSYIEDETTKALFEPEVTQQIEDYKAKIFNS